MKQDTWDSIDTFNGAHLTVEATFLDGKTESRTLHPLHRPSAAGSV
ncbi:MAG: hypothetical protein ACLSHO_06330 [Dysosmobacter sp.]